MKNLNKKLATVLLTTSIMGGVSAATTDSIDLIGFIEKAVSVSFYNSVLDLGDMSTTSIANFTVIANTDYTVSAPTAGTLLNADNNAELDFAVSISKENSTMSITPAPISVTQAAGNYSANVTLTVAAV